MGQGILVIARETSLAAAHDLNVHSLLARRWCCFVLRLQEGLEVTV